MIKATEEEMRQEALNRLEILVSYGVDEKIIEHFERDILWAYSRYEDTHTLEGMFPAHPCYTQRMKLIDKGSRGKFLTYCICYLHEKKGEEPIPCQITVSNDKAQWTSEREYLLTTCGLLTPMDKETVSNYAENAEWFQDFLELLGVPIYKIPA